MVNILDLRAARSVQFGNTSSREVWHAGVKIWQAPEEPGVVEHTIFGSTIPASLTSYNDGVTNYWTGMQFYTTPEFPSGMVITRGRILIPEGSMHEGQPYSMALSKRDIGDGILLPEQSPSALDSGFATNGSKADGILDIGWNEIEFTGGPYTLNPGDGFLVGALISGGSGYLYNSDLGVSYFESATAPGFRLAEYNRRCEYNGSWSSADWYGLDVVISEA